jgi:hypothetical protein
MQNFSIGKNFGYQDAIAQLPFAPAFTVSLGKVSRKFCYNLFAIFGALTLEYFGLNAIANLPIEKGDFGIDGNGGALFGGINKLTNFAKKGLRCYLDIWSHLLRFAIGFVHFAMFLDQTMRNNLILIKFRYSGINK